MAEENIQHQGEITISAIVYKKMPNGMFHPEAVWNKSIAVKFQSDNAKDCIDELEKKIGAIKDA